MSKFLIILLGILLSHCTTTTPHETPETFKPRGINKLRAQYIDSGKSGMVTAAHPIASKAGVEVLKQGGNAIDAAIAVSFVISVVRPQSTGIGGGGFLMYRNTNNQKVEAWDFREEAPLKAHRDMYLDEKGQPKPFKYKGKEIPRASVNGHQSAGTPGLVAGLWEIHKAHGSLPWKNLLQPAIIAARDGIPVYPNLARAIDRRKSVLSVFDGSRAIFYPKGVALKAGDTLFQKDLAKTLEAIAEKGADGFYKGAVAKLIAEEMKRHNGLITEKDLLNYEVKKREPIEGDFRGHKIYSMPPPSSGGIHIVQMLNILEGFDGKKKGRFSPEYINLLTEAMRHAYADRATHLGDPDFYKVPIKGLTSDGYANEIRKKLSVGKAGDSSKIGPGNPIPYEQPSTTHFSIVDKNGNAVSSTQTINYTFGSGVVIPGTGILMNDEMDDFSIKADTPNAFGLIGYEANSIKPGKRMLSSMSPSIITKSNQVQAIVGSPGGSRIITATLQVILNRIEFGMTPEDAVHSFRTHHQWKPDKIYFEESGMAPQTKASLESMGYTLSSSRWNIGDVQAIFYDNGVWVGVSDTRSDGQPMGY
ncbi:MAG: gamma-glutamyltransferase [Pseudobacteriovorax sp.]|nr:gamma-glutamyltransferase [Pseudobacteriovorax sp.]